MRQLKERHLSGVTDEELRDYEIRHKVVARKAATEGMVLLKNDNDLLPLSKGSKVSLYGAGAIHMIKGGTGSGNVNNRGTVEIKDGLLNAGFVIANMDWLTEYEQIYMRDKIAWRDDLIRRSHEPGGNLFELHAGNPLPSPKGSDPVPTEADIAIYVLTRVSGEGADRKDAPGDFRVSEEEKEFLTKLNKIYAHIILVLNIGGLMDLSFTDELGAIDSIIYMMQPGMEGGNALADILAGDVTPSGKLTDTWAYKYVDYPTTATFSANDGSTEFEEYKEGIYVGYRYFDTFGVSVRNCFGFGLSYTKFDIKTDKVEILSHENTNPRILVSVTVTNIGDQYVGKEVVQIYVSCPDGKMDKEYRRLVGFKKTKLLGPGMSEQMTIAFPLEACTSYDETAPGFILDGGYYGVWVGNSLGSSKLRGMFKLDRSIVMKETKNVCPVINPFDEIVFQEGRRIGKYKSWVERGRDLGLPVVSITADSLKPYKAIYGERSVDTNPEAYAFAQTLSEEELICLATGDPAKRENGGMDFLGSGGVSVPGSAAETSRVALEKGLGSLVLSDGPAGLRLDNGYYVSKDGNIERREFIDTVEEGFFSEKQRVMREGDVLYHQYCTAFPIGTLLAQTWDTELVEEVGRAVGEEMEIFQTSLWLAPGMNIHRNPLCGRNFEYYSEDPLISGIIAAAMTKGVQSIPGCGTTIKHYACNNQEENRLHCDSRVHERALREIYLKGFEVCIRSARPMSIMTSYNLINGVHTANSYDLCSTLARDEWGFTGFIMTDWTTTEQGPDCTAAGCIKAGNDLVCPGCEGDHESIREALDNGTLSKEELLRCISRIVNIAWQSNAYEGVQSYNNQFGELYKFIEIE